MTGWEGMPLAEVLAVLDDLRTAGCRAWVAGGWGVDALVGRQTRAHRDLDLAVDAADEARALGVLAGRGYRVETDGRPVRVELARAGVGWVDLHPVVFDDAGHGRQADLDGGTFDYPPAAFAAGSLDGVATACLSLDQQVAFRRGYALRPVDRHDLALLDALRPARRLHDRAPDAAALTTAATASVLRPMRRADLARVGVVQEEGSVVALAHVFPQASHPFPRADLRARWERELADPALDCFVIVGPDGAVAGFAAIRADELLHFGTALSTWGSGLARRAHDELVDHVRRQGHGRARLWVFEENGHARRFYEHRGWRPSGARTTSTFPPRPVLLGYELALDGG